MKTLAKYHVCNHCVIGEKTFKNILVGPGKLPGLSGNGPLGSENGYEFKIDDEKSKDYCKADTT